jgi:catechol 2,3-dioxygenase-like lactoylglutathione lyase family enzyme
VSSFSGIFARMKVNGIAHIQLTVNNLRACIAFYERLLNFLEMATVWKSAQGLYCVGSRTAIAVTRSDPEHRAARFVQRRIGLHHLCFRAYSREDVDRIHAFVVELGATVVHPPEEGPWAQGYYSVLFEDPDGIRLEVNHVPGQGNLGADVELPLKHFPGFEDYSEM